MDTTSVAFVYHLCSREMRGTTLLPLNGLKDRYPDVYARERKKWEGRESVLDWVVPGLGVPWADTVNLSGLDPRLLMAARVRLGVPFSRLLERPLARIPIERIAAMPAVVYNSATHWINSSPGEDVPLTPPDTEFAQFDPETYSEPREVPQLHVDYLLRQKSRGQLALGFVSCGTCSSPARSTCLESISSRWKRRPRAAKEGLVQCGECRAGHGSVPGLVGHPRILQGFGGSGKLGISAPTRGAES